MPGPGAARHGRVGSGSRQLRHHLAPADRACRRAWWSLALYPVTFVAAFVVGEGLITLLTDDVRHPVPWQVLVAATPAMLVFVVPGVLALVEGRKAVRLGRADGRVPAAIGVAIGLGFVFLNVLPYLVGLALG